MEKFKPRYIAPSKNDKRFINYQYGGWSIAIPIDKTTGYTLPNCAGYAHGRLLEILGRTSVDWKIPASNGEDFLDKAKENGMSTGTVPKLGAAICWRAGQKHNSADGYGHVAIVEKIYDNGDILVSQSGLNGLEFYTTRLTKASGYIYSADRPLEGFVYCGIEFEQETPALAPTPSKPDESTDNYYRVQIGSFTVYNNAVKRYKEAQTKGFSPIIKKFKQYYRVQVGAYTLKSNADAMLQKAKSAGYADAYITQESGVDVAVK